MAIKTHEWHTSNIQIRQEQQQHAQLAPTYTYKYQHNTHRRAECHKIIIKINLKKKNHKRLYYSSFIIWILLHHFVYLFNNYSDIAVVRRHALHVLSLLWSCCCCAHAYSVRKRKCLHANARARVCVRVWALCAYAFSACLRVFALSATIVFYERQISNSTY